ncbi:MAG TPA: hypothetical protein VGF99_22050 [Myxococcota bacterium]
MNPIGAIVLAVWLFRAVRWALRKAGVLETPTTTKERRTWRDHSGTYVATWAVVGAFSIVCMIGLGEATTVAARLGFAAGLVVAAVVLAPWPLARWIAIPLGLPRVAAALGFLASFTFGRDRAGGAALAAVLAATSARRRRPTTSDAAVSWTRTRVQQLDLLSAAGVVATALLADLDGDPATGDALLATLSSFDERVVPARARSIAAERRVHRLLRGDLDDRRQPRAARIAARRAQLLSLDAARSPFVQLVQALLLLDETPDDTTLRFAARWWWLLSPRRRRTLPWLTRRPAGWPLPVATSMAPRTPASADDDDNDANVLFRALRLHVAARREPPSLPDTVDVARAWALCLPATREAVRRRAAELRVDGEAVVVDVDRTVQQALVAMAEPLDFGDVDIDTLPEPLAEAVGVIRSQRLDALETINGAWRGRVEGAVDLAPVDELREWVALVALVESVAKTGVDGRYLAYEAVQWAVCERAVRLWNIACEHRLANAMFRWLLGQAEAVADSRGIETQLANVKCGP